MRKLIDGYALIKWIKETQHQTSKMKNIICKIETMPDAESTGALDDAICEYVVKGFMPNPYDRPKGVYDSITLVNRETEREDLSDEIREYLFCDLRKKLWGLDSRPQEWIPLNTELPTDAFDIIGFHRGEFASDTFMVVTKGVGDEFHR